MLGIAGCGCWLAMQETALRSNNGSLGFTPKRVSNGILTVTTIPIAYPETVREWIVLLRALGRNTVRFHSVGDSPMTESLQTLSAAAKRLNPTERLELVEQLLDSLDTPDASIDGQWAKEAEDRLAAWRRGEIRAIPLDEVLARYARR